MCGGAGETVGLGPLQGSLPSETLRCQVCVPARPSTGPPSMTNRRLQPGCRQEGQKDRRAEQAPHLCQAQEPGTKGPPFPGPQRWGWENHPSLSPRAPHPLPHHERPGPQRQPRPLDPPRFILLVEGLGQKIAKVTCRSVEVD